MKKTVFGIIVLLFTASFSLAGVVMEMQSKDLPSGKQTESSTIHAQGGKVRMDSVQSGKRTSMIFADKTMWIIDHQKKEVIKIDQEKMEKLAGQMNAAMKQMEETLAKLPPEQREMMEKMMKGSMDKVTPKTPQVRLEEAGSGTWDKYTCKKYILYVDDTKSEEICAASPDQIEGADEAMEAFKAMAEFSTKLLQAVQKSPFLNMAQIQSPLQQMSKMEGVPVQSIHFEKGKPAREQTLKTSSKQDLDASAFMPPADYKLQDPFKGK